ncbi:ABC transporter ATP-binding protein [Homoserinimonas sp. A447]
MNASSPAAGPALRVRDLNVVFKSRHGAVHAVDQVTFDVGVNEIFAVVGESGSGKSTIVNAITGLLPQKAEVSGTVSLGSTEILSLKPGQRRLLSGERIALVSQDALAALNPSTTVGFQIAETLMVRRRQSRRAAFARAEELLDLVGVSRPKEGLRAYPHQFSGGMRQRALIAVALSLEPELLVADEPTTALDVTVKTQILDLLLSLRAQLGMSVLLVTHDMGVVARVADRMLLMGDGNMLEMGDVDSVFHNPTHRKTVELLSAVPVMPQGSYGTHTEGNERSWPN